MSLEGAARATPRGGTVHRPPRRDLPEMFTSRRAHVGLRPTCQRGADTRVDNSCIGRGCFPDDDALFGGVGESELGGDLRLVYPADRADVENAEPVVRLQEGSTGVY